ncbi:MAG: hypothetical protein ACE5HW_04620 [Candidatus Methanofastidiosia archaeon]
MKVSFSILSILILLMTTSQVAAQPQIQLSGWIIVEGENYYLDTNNDQIPDFKLDFGPLWYEPKNGAKRPRNGEFVTLKGKFKEDKFEVYAIDMNKDGDTEDLEDWWRDPGKPPWASKKKPKLKGGSQAGHFLGIFGTILLLLSQIYSVRKRYGFKVESVRIWLRIHIFLGVVGPLMILLHAGFPYDFKMELFKEGFAGLSTILMMIIVLSGFFGRYLYRRIEKGMKEWFGKWRIFHINLVLFFFLTVLLHILYSLGDN